MNNLALCVDSGTKFAYEPIKGMAHFPIFFRFIRILDVWVTNSDAISLMNEKRKLNIEL